MGLKRNTTFYGCLAALLLLLSSFVQAGAAAARPLRILCSFFPVYEFTRNVVAGRAGVDVELMLPPALGCPHDYLLTPQDMTRIAQADVFVANGVGLEEFLGAPLRRANPKVTVIDASAGIKNLIPSQGEEAKHHEGCNPHLFASPALAAKMVRNIAAGSFSKRFGVEEGTVFSSPTLEFSLKNDALGDPMINGYHVLAMNLATNDEIALLTKYSFAINDILKEYFLTRDITLVDFKLEFGKTADGTIVLADEISPDTCRFWDVHTGEKLDKDRFRRDLGGEEEAYMEILKRLLGQTLN
jgi:hypothetical protein